MLNVGPSLALRETFSMTRILTIAAVLTMLSPTLSSAADVLATLSPIPSTAAGVSPDPAVTLVKKRCLPRNYRCEKIGNAVRGTAINLQGVTAAIRSGLQTLPTRCVSFII